MADMAQVQRLIARGYGAIPTKEGTKHWRHKNRKGQSLYHADRVTDPEITLEAFRDDPSAGLSVLCPHIYNSNLKLVGIDQDTSFPDLDEVTTHRIATIIDRPGPVKTGQKGRTYFCTTSQPVNLGSMFHARNGVSPKWLTQAKITAPKASPEEELQHIDIIGYAQFNHTLLPPTLHPSGRPYRWVEFPGTNIVRRLEDTDPEDLPHLEPAHFLLLTMIFEPKYFKIWEFLGATGPGDWNDRMRDGTLAMWHEGFTQEEILQLALREAHRTAPNAAKYEERAAEARGTIASLNTKFPRRNPAASSTPARRRAGHTPIERQQTDWLLATLEEENCATFLGEPYQWDGNHWVNMKDANGSMSVWFSKAFRAFVNATNQSTGSALRSFVQIISKRLPCSDPVLIPFANGVLDVRNLTLRPEQKEDNITSCIPLDFVLGGACPIWDKFLSDLLLPPPADNPAPGDHQRAIDVVEEFLGYCLTRSYAFRYFLLLIGRTSTGKSVLTKILKGILPPEWISEVALDDLGQPNSLRRMANSLINVSAEVGRTSNNDLYGKSVDDAVLRITSKEPVEVKTLYQDSISVALPSRIIVNGNLVPRFRDVTGAMEKRMLLIKTTDIQPEQILMFENIVLQEKEAIVAKLVLAYQRLLERQHFILPVYSQVEASRTTAEANSVSIWFYSQCVIQPLTKDQKGTPKTQAYSEYKMWCDLNGYRPPFAIAQFGHQLRQLRVPEYRPYDAGGNRSSIRYWALTIDPANANSHLDTIQTDGEY